MWTVIKLDKKKINLFKKDFKNKIDNDFYVLKTTFWLNLK